MVNPERADVAGDDVVSTFCCHILFFVSVEEAAGCARARDDGTYVLTLDAAFELGWNALRFAEALDSPTVIDA